MVNIFKGVLIGIGKIIPGVSGSMIAISLGVYKKMLKGIAELNKLEKKNFIFLTQISIGILFSIFFLSKIILYLLKNYYLYTTFLFIGLIIGGIPSILKIAKESKKKINLIYLLLPMILFFILSFLAFNMKLEINALNLFIIGLIESVTMVVPGVSGTAILMYLGVYDEILYLITDINNIQQLLIFSTGVATGIILLAKICIHFVEKYKYETYYFILGLALSTTLIILKETLQVPYNFFELLCSVIILGISSLISFNYFN